MNANELRVGNLIRWISTGEIDTVKDIATAGRKDAAINNVNISDCSGIELSEDWMERFGLMFDPDNRIWSILTSIGNYDYSFEIFQIPQEEFFFFKESEILYVHQLQNLYFTLTGRELEDAV